MSTGYWSGLFSHVEERGCCRLVTAGGSCLPLLWWVVGLGSRWQIWIVAKLMLDRIISFVPFPPKCFLGSVRCLFYHVCVRLSTLATPQIHPSHMRGSYFHCHKVLYLLGLFSRFQSIFDWARLWFKLENTSSLPQDLIYVCHGLNGLGTGWHWFCQLS